MNRDILERDYNGPSEDEGEERMTLRLIAETKPKTKVVREFFKNIIDHLEDESLKEFE